jgi:hypothetical protein
VKRGSDRSEVKARGQGFAEGVVGSRSKSVGAGGEV